MLIIMVMSRTLGLQAVDADSDSATKPQLPDKRAASREHARKVAAAENPTTQARAPLNAATSVGRTAVAMDRPEDGGCESERASTCA